MLLSSEFISGLSVAALAWVHTLVPSDRGARRATSEVEPTIIAHTCHCVADCAPTAPKEEESRWVLFGFGVGLFLAGLLLGIACGSCCPRSVRHRLQVAEQAAVTPALRGRGVLTLGQ